MMCRSILLALSCVAHTNGGLPKQRIMKYLRSSRYWTERSIDVRRAMGTESIRKSHKLGNLLFALHPEGRRALHYITNTRERIDRIRRNTPTMQLRGGHSLAPVEIEMPDAWKHRSYDYLKLENGMQVLLVSDPNCDKAAAALCVGVGKLHEPKDMPGLAHFCEHMLFLGTKKFPDEAEYKEYIKGHGGSNNAATADSYTYYYFDIAPPFLGGALDRFSQQFVAPLFTPCSTEREIMAVDSEHVGRITDEGRRALATLWVDANPDHPWHWGSGNAKTLRDEPRARGLDMHSEVVKFWENQYSAEDMSLTVTGRESLDELRSMVESCFSDVRSTGRRALRGDEHGGAEPAITRKDFHGLVLRVPSKDMRSLRFSWLLPEWHVPQWQVQPDAYATRLLGDEGKGSLLSVLKAKGWATSVSAGISDLGCFSVFDVSVSLTEDGLDHVVEIGRLLFLYIRLMQTEPIQEWLLQEQKMMRSLQFRFADDTKPRSLVQQLAQNLQSYPPDKVLSGPSTLHELNPEATKLFLERLTVDGLRVRLTAKRFADKCTSTDPWYNGLYSKRPLDEEWLRIWETARSEGTVDEEDSLGLRFPEPNPMIPKNTDLRALVKSETDYPLEITSSVRVFHRQDDKFRQPKAVLDFAFHVPADASDTAPDVEAFLKRQIWCSAIEEELNEEIGWDATVAGLGYSLSVTDFGFVLSVSGFNDKQSVLLRSVLRKMHAYNVMNPKTFSIVHDRYVRAYNNSAFQLKPLQLASRKLSDLHTNLLGSVEERLSQVRKLHLDDFNEMSDYILNNCRIEALMMGNLNTQDAKGIASIVSEELGVPSTPKTISKLKEAQLLDGYTVWEINGTNAEESNNAVMLKFQIPKSLRNTVLMSVLDRVLSPKFFESLRTQQQLGYIVGTQLSPGPGSLHWTLYIQSEYSPDYIRARMDFFLNEYLSWVESELDEKEFDRQREGLLSNFREEPKNLGAEVSRRWVEIERRRFDFARKETLIKAMEMASLEDLRSVVREVVRSSPRIYAQVKSISGNVAKQPANVNNVALATPNRVWKGDEDAKQFRIGATWIANDWNSQDTYSPQSNS